MSAEKKCKVCGSRRVRLWSGFCSHKCSDRYYHRRKYEAFDKVPTEFPARVLTPLVLDGEVYRMGNIAGMTNEQVPDLEAWYQAKEAWLRFLKKEEELFPELVAA